MELLPQVFLDIGISTEKVNSAVHKLNEWGITNLGLFLQFKEAELNELGFENESLIVRLKLRKYIQDKIDENSAQNLGNVISPEINIFT